MRCEKSRRADGVRENRTRSGQWDRLCEAAALSRIRGKNEQIKISTGFPILAPKNLPENWRILRIWGNPQYLTNNSDFLSPIMTRCAFTQGFRWLIFPNLPKFSDFFRHYAVAWQEFTEKGKRGAKTSIILFFLAKNKCNSIYSSNKIFQLIT